VGSGSAGLPASVINQYRERLGQEGLDFLAHGPRTFEDQLAYAQWVRPNAYRNSRPASLEDQLHFRQSRAVDWANNFIGPDGIVYVRDHAVGEEEPEARIFRAYEKMVGGFKRPKLDDLLEQFDLADPREGYSPETKAKVAEVEQFDRPLSTDEKAWRAWAREQEVNPLTWFKGEKLPEFYQDNYQFGITRDVAPAWGTSIFVGPDGLVYRQNKLTRPDRATAVSKGLEHEWAMEARRAAVRQNPWSALWDGWEVGGPVAFAGVVRNPGGKRGSSGTQADLEAILNQARPRNEDLEHFAGSKNKQGASVKEEWIAGPGHGHEGSVSPDASLRTKDWKRVFRIEHQDMDMKTGKASQREVAKQLTEFKRTQSQGYKDVPWSYVLGILKRAHQRKYQEKLDRQRRSKQRPRREDDDDKQ